MKEETPFLPGFDLKETEEVSNNVDIKDLADDEKEEVECAQCEIYGGQGCPRHQKRKVA